MNRIIKLINKKGEKNPQLTVLENSIKNTLYYSC